MHSPISTHILLCLTQEHVTPGLCVGMLESKREIENLCCAGESMFEMFTPAKLGQHRLFFTCAWTFVIFTVFWYMIGEFPYYEAVQFPVPQTSACLSNITSTPMGYGSSQMVHWINQVGNDCPRGLGHNSWIHAIRSASLITSGM